jgi:hypothetical protein
VQPANFSLEAGSASRDVLWAPARLVYFQYLCDDTPLMLRVTLREFVGRVMAFHGTMITAASLAGARASTVLSARYVFYMNVL